MKNAALIVSRNPLDSSSDVVTEIRPGGSIASHIPDDVTSAVVLVNGVPVSRLTSDQRDRVNALDGDDCDLLLGQYVAEAKNWETRFVMPGDVVTISDAPHGKNTGLIIGVVLDIVSIFVPVLAPYLGPLALSLEIGGIISLLMPSPRQQDTTPTGLGVYSSSLSGNVASLDQPIWKAMGRPKFTPNFACQPYAEYRPRDLANPVINSDQFMYGLLAVSVDDPADILETAFIANSRISHFLDVERATYLPPGTQPSFVNPAVVTCEEVNGNLEMPLGKYLGPFVICRPGDVVTDVGIDIGANSGLGRIGAGGDAQSVTVNWRVQARQIDDFGSPLADWFTLANASRTADINQAQRWTEKYKLASPMRVEVRVAKTLIPPNVYHTESTALQAIQWIGMRGYLARVATLNPNVGHFEVVMRSSDQLNSLTQRDFSLIMRCACPTLNSDLTRNASTFNRNPFWWLLELWTNPIWGEGLPDARIDLRSIYNLAQIADARQDHFDYVLTSSTNSWDMAQLIARCGRARVFRRYGIYTVARDQAADIPRGAITARMAQPNSMAMNVTLSKREAADGYVVQYQSNVTWDVASIDCPCPGFSARSSDQITWNPGLPSMQNPVFVTLDGISGFYHALREGLYQAAAMLYRRTTTTAKIEMERLRFSFMDTIRWLPDIANYGQAGDVVDFNIATKVMTLTEPPDWSTAQSITWHELAERVTPGEGEGLPTSGMTPTALFLTLQRDDGSLWGPSPVTQGPSAYQVLLRSVPDFDLDLDSANRERPKYLLGNLSAGDEMVKVSGITGAGLSDQGAQLYTVTGYVDDDLVHTADAPYLPGPGTVQDPIDDGIEIVDVPFQTTVTIDARSNKGFARGITITGMNPDWVLSMALIVGRFTAWSEFASDTDSFATPGAAWSNQFQVTNDLGVGSETFGAKGIAPTAEAARAAFGGGTITGSTSYTFWFDSDGIDDNRGGLTIQLTKD